MKFTFRNWLIYFAAWIPYALSYVAVFFAQSSTVNLFFDVRTAFLNVIPAAICGVLVVVLCEKLSWSNHRRIWFFPAHFVFAIAFSALWYAAVLLFLTVELSFRTGRFSPVSFSGFALQWQLFSGLMIYGTIASVVYVLQIAASLQFEKQRAIEAERLAAEANLAALRAQLNPHFLFNTLHSLMALVRTDADTAESAIERFAAMLRYVLQSQNEKQTATADVTFADEWNFVCNYLELERLRLGDRLQLTTEIEPAALLYRLPAFSLQPIVENAVKHAIAPRAGGGRLNIAARTDDDNLIIKVSDDGIGNSSPNGQNGNGLGLRLVRESLAVRFGSAASLTTESAPNEGFKVSITIPKTNSSGKDFNLSENGRQIL